MLIIRLLAEPIFDQQFRGPHVDSNPGCQDMMKPLDHLRHQFSSRRLSSAKNNFVSTNSPDFLFPRWSQVEAGASRQLWNFLKEKLKELN